MIFFRNFLLVITGVLAILALLFSYWRAFGEDTLALGCAVRLQFACEVEVADQNQLDLDDLIQEIQDSLKQVQAKNIGAKTPHMFFVDDLELELFFQVQQKEDATLKLLVVPAEAGLEQSESQSQRLALKFSTIVDESIRSYLTEACKDNAIFDERATFFCEQSRSVTAADSVTVETDKLDFDVSTLFRDYRFGETFTDTQGSVPSWQSGEKLCDKFDFCADSGVTKYDFEFDKSAVSGFQLDVPYSNEVVEALKAENAFKGWNFEESTDGKLQLQVPGS